MLLVHNVIKRDGRYPQPHSRDAIIATAILDRLLHHSTTVDIRGESYRLKDKKRAGFSGASLVRQEVSRPPK